MISIIFTAAHGKVNSQISPDEVGLFPGDVAIEQSA